MNYPTNSDWNSEKYIWPYAKSVQFYCKTNERVIPDENEHFVNAKSNDAILNFMSSDFMHWNITDHFVYVS